MRAERGRIRADGLRWWERARRGRFGGMMGSYEMMELRRAMIDEVEVVLKGVVEKYDNKVRFVGGVGEGGW